MSKRLHSLKEKHQSVGDVRGIGLFWALELVKNRKTRTVQYSRGEARGSAALN